MPLLDPLPFDFGEISKAEAEEFVSAVGKVLKLEELGKLYLVNKGADGFALSFDGEWYPFIGMHIGLNPKQDRTPLADGVTLIRKLVELLRRESRARGSRAGGRYFLSLDGVQRVAGSDRVHVVKWNWPLTTDETFKSTQPSKR